MALTNLIRLNVQYSWGFLFIEKKNIFYWKHSQLSCVIYFDRVAHQSACIIHFAEKVLLAGTLCKHWLWINLTRRRATDSPNRATLKPVAILFVTRLVSCIWCETCMFFVTHKINRLDYGIYRAPPSFLTHQLTKNFLRSRRF